LGLVEGDDDELRARMKERIRRLSEVEVSGTLEMLLALERRISLAPLVARLDEAAMRYSIEVRVPYLQGEVPRLARARRLDDRPLTVTKPDLRCALTLLLGPRATVPKRPLRVALDDWLRNSVLREVVRKIRASAEEEHVLPLEPPAVASWIETMVRERRSGDLLVATRLYQLLRYIDRFGNMEHVAGRGAAIREDRVR
jgi:hypothetical protein